MNLHQSVDQYTVGRCGTRRRGETREGPRLVATGVLRGCGDGPGLRTKRLFPRRRSVPAGIQPPGTDPARTHTGAKRTRAGEPALAFSVHASGLIHCHCSNAQQAPYRPRRLRQDCDAPSIQAELRRDSRRTLATPVSPHRPENGKCSKSWTRVVTRPPRIGSTTSRRSPPPPGSTGRSSARCRSRLSRCPRW